MQQYYKVLTHYTKWYNISRRQTVIRQLLITIIDLNGINNQLKGRDGQMGF